MQLTGQRPASLLGSPRPCNSASLPFSSPGPGTAAGSDAKRSGARRGSAPACGPGLGWSVGGCSMIPAELKQATPNPASSSVGRSIGWMEQIPRLSLDLPGGTRPQTLDLDPRGENWRDPYPHPTPFLGVLWVRLPAASAPKDWRELELQPGCPARSEGGESSRAGLGGWVYGGGFPFLASSPLPLQRRSPHLHSRVRDATLTVSEQRREAEQGGAAAARHPRGHGRGGRRWGGGTVDDTWPQLASVTSNSTQAVLCGCFGVGGARRAIWGHFEGWGSPGSV